jgi:serine/threonine protein kinase
VNLHEVYEDDLKIYLVMDMLKGGELFDRIIAKGNFSEKDACVLMRQLFQEIKGIFIMMIINC